MKRILRRIAIGTLCFFACLGLAESIALSQSESAVDQPLFRERTDPMATRDADAVRERLKSLSDSRGPINPLADYVKPKEKTKRDSIDEESHRAPSLDPEAQRRLKAQPPSVAKGERYIIGLLPPPRITSNSGTVITNVWQDDGFRPLPSVALESASIPSAPIASGPIGGAPTGGMVVQSNYQMGDPAAMVPPTLSPPSTNLPPYSASPSGLPPMSPSQLSVPSVGQPLPGPPITAAPPIGAPATIAPPPGAFGAAPGGIPMTGAPGGYVIPAPPSYIVPGPNAYAPTTTTPAPYAAPTPTYSRTGGTVNSLPFVSAPPQARDARWMVSPEVYRRMEGGVCATPSDPAYGAPMAGAGTGSPFFYAPPTAMPMPTPRTASRYSWLHPFRH